MNLERQQRRAHYNHLVVAMCGPGLCRDVTSKHQENQMDQDMLLDLAYLSEMTDVMWCSKDLRVLAVT